MESFAAFAGRARKKTKPSREGLAIRVDYARTMKPTHGGKRPGAGRKPQVKAKRSLTIRLSEPARDRLDEIKRATGESSSSVLERALKKSGWRGPLETGAQRHAHAVDRRRAEREEHRHGRPEGL